MEYHSAVVEEVLKNKQTSLQGLSQAEVQKRLQEYGPNELKEKKKINPIFLFLNQFNSVLVWILIAAVGISAYLKEWTDAAVIIFILILNAIIGFIQEYRAEKSIEALKKLGGSKAIVIRDGKEHEVAAKELVPGDIIILDVGEKVPADCRLVEITDLEVDESSLTGESLPVKKALRLLGEKTALADRINMAYSGTIITKGRAKAIVVETGMKTEIGKLAHLIQETEARQTPLQQNLEHLGRILAISVIVITAIIFATGIMQGKELLMMLIVAISLAVAAVPEGLPAVVTIALAIGIQKMVKKKALIRKLPSVETLGCVDVICTDKTGTLTHNEMTVKRIFLAGENIGVTGEGYSKEGAFSTKSKDLEMLLKAGTLCNNSDINFFKDKQPEIVGDPTEVALIVSAAKLSMEKEALEKRYPRVGEIVFTSERKMMTTLHKPAAPTPEEKGKIFAFSKGAPDVLVERCDFQLINGKVKRLSKEEKAAILKKNEQYAKEAMRVLGFAYKAMPLPESPATKTTTFKKEDIEKSMIFIGLQAMIDPPRKEAKEAIQKCTDAGIRVIMITGDHETTALAVAAELGIKGKSMTGKELDEHPDLSEVIHEISIFARVNPEHKMKIVAALEKRGHITAMTGDGVNDAPALKKADIGIAMGIAGTDVAKEASDMILLDDNFVTIVNAVEEGRGIYDNIVKFVNYLLSCNIAEVFIIFFAMIFNLGLPLTAAQLLWLNVVTDGLPALALSADPHSADIMKKRPRKKGQHIIDRTLGEAIIMIGVLITAGVLGIFWYYTHHFDMVRAMTVAFTALVVLEIVRLYIIRSNYNIGFFSNKYLIWAIGVSLFMQMLVVYTPLNRFFETVPLTFADWIAICIVVAATLIVVKVTKMVKKRFEKPERSTF